MAVSQTLGVEREVRLAAGTINVRERGEGPPLLFVHGVGVNGDLWRHVVPLLADRWRCITPDWPLGAHTRPMDAGADLSPPALAAMVVELMDALGLERATLVGSDTGGAVCQMVLARWPQRVERLALASCDAFEYFPPPGAAHIPLVARIPGALWLAAQGSKLRAIRRSALVFGPVASADFPPEIVRSYLGPARDAAIRRDAGKAFRGLNRRWTLEAARAFADRPQPVLVAWSADDGLFPMALGRRLAAAFPNAEFAVIEGARAFSPEDAPQALADAVRAFLIRTEAPLARALASP